MYEQNVKIYENAIVQNCSFYNDGGQIIGEDSYVKESFIGKCVRINRRNFIQGCTLDNYSYTGHNTTLKYATIGKFTCISWNVSAGGANHDYTKLSTHPFYFLSTFCFTDENETYNSYQEPLIIDNDVWIGSGVEILRGITIGDGAVIGAGSVITKDVPPYSIVVGNPGKVLKYRFSDEIIHKLLKMQWWNYDENKIKNILPYFRRSVTIELLNEIEGRLIEGI